MTLIWDYTLNWIKQEYYYQKNTQSLVYFYENHELQLIISRNTTFF